MGNFTQIMTCFQKHKESTLLLFDCCQTPDGSMPATAVASTAPVCFDGPLICACAVSKGHTAYGDRNGSLFTTKTCAALKEAQFKGERLQDTFQIIKQLASNLDRYERCVLYDPGKGYV